MEASRVTPPFSLGAIHSAEMTGLGRRDPPPACRLPASAGTGTHVIAAADDGCAIVSFLACSLNGPTGSCLRTGLLKPLKRPALHERRFLTSQFQIPPNAVLRMRTTRFFRHFITQPHSPTIPSRRGFFRRANRWRVTTTTTITPQSIQNPWFSPPAPARLIPTFSVCFAARTTKSWCPSRVILFLIFWLTFRTWP